MLWSLTGKVGARATTSLVLDGTDLMVLAVGVEDPAVGVDRLRGVLRLPEVRHRWPVADGSGKNLIERKIGDARDGHRVLRLTVGSLHIVLKHHGHVFGENLTTTRLLDMVAIGLGILGLEFLEQLVERGNVLDRVLVEGTVLLFILIMMIPSTNLPSTAQFVCRSSRPSKTVR